MGCAKVLDGNTLPLGVAVKCCLPQSDGVPWFISEDGLLTGCCRTGCGAASRTSTRAHRNTALGGYLNSVVGFSELGNLAA